MARWWKDRLSMFRFYLALLRDALSAWRGVIEAVLFWLGIALSIGLLLNKALVRRMNTSWEGLSPWWGAGVLSVLFMYRLAKANFDKFVAIEKARDDAFRRLSGAGHLIVEEQDPKIYLDPLNEEFVKTGTVPFIVSNKGQRVNVAHSIQVQPPSVAPSVIFDYIDHLDQNQKYVLSPIAKGMVLDHHNILVELEKARRDSGLGETLLFDIEITYEDVTRSKKFRTTVKLEYFPEEERAAGRDAFNRKITHEILKVKDTVIRRVA